VGSRQDGFYRLLLISSAIFPASRYTHAEDGLNCKWKRGRINYSQLSNTKVSCPGVYHSIRLDFANEGAGNARIPHLFCAFADSVGHLLRRETGKTYGPSLMAFAGGGTQPSPTLLILASQISAWTEILNHPRPISCESIMFTLVIINFHATLLSRQLGS
jgi:hypothetical protein